MDKCIVDQCGKDFYISCTGKRYCEEHGVFHIIMENCQKNCVGQGNHSFLLRSACEVREWKEEIQEKLRRVEGIFKLQGEKTRKNIKSSVKNLIEYVKGRNEDEKEIRENSEFMKAERKKLENMTANEVLTGIIQIFDIHKRKDPSYIDLLNDVCEKRVQIHLQANEILKQTKKIQDFDMILLKSNEFYEKQIAIQKSQISNLSQLFNNIVSSYKSMQDSNFLSPPSKTLENLLEPLATPPSDLFFFKDTSKSLVKLNFFNSSTTISQMPIENAIGRLGVICAISPEKLFFYGGWFESLQDAYILNTKSLEISVKSPYHRCYIAGSASYKGKVYIFGGSDNGETAISTSVCYDSKSDTWNELLSLPSASFFNTSALKSNSICTVGFQLTHCYSYEILENKYTYTLDLPIGAKLICNADEVLYVICNDNLYVQSNSTWDMVKQNLSLPEGWGLVGYVCRHGEFLYFLFNDHVVRRLNIITKVVEDLGFIKGF